MSARAGARALSLLAVPLNVHILEALEDKRLSLIELRRAVGSPPQTTMRSQLRTLDEMGIVERRRQADLPGSIDYELAVPGKELLFVAQVAQTWLAAGPNGPAQLGSPAAKSAIKALVDGWSSTIIRALAARPLSLTELSRLIPRLSYPSIERRLGAARLAGLIDAHPSRTRGTPYVATDWLRHAIAPLVAAVRWEQRHVEGAAPIGRLDVESLFLLAVPLINLGEEADGSCRLAIGIQAGDHRNAAGVLIRVTRGRVISCVSRPQGMGDAWVLGTFQAWVGALIDDRPDQLEIGGKRELGMEIVFALRDALFRTPQAAHSLNRASANSDSFGLQGL